MSLSCRRLLLYVDGRRYQSRICLASFPFDAFTRSSQLLSIQSFLRYLPPLCLTLASDDAIKSYLDTIRTSVWPVVWPYRIPYGKVSRRMAVPYYGTANINTAV
jgi:hypothetical protein